MTIGEKIAFVAMPGQGVTEAKRRLEQRYGGVPPGGGRRECALQSLLAVIGLHPDQAV